MILMWTRAIVAPLLAIALCSCEQQKDKPRRSPDLGLKVIPAGDKPARAPGSKGAMIHMDDREVRILLVRPDSPAELAGFRAGDVIRTMDGEEVRSEADLRAAVRAAAARNACFEVRRDRKLLTLDMRSSEPGWLVLSGDSFKGFLLTRIQSQRSVRSVPAGAKAPELRLPTLSGPPFVLSSLRNRPVAVIFWGTFSEPCYAHLQALDKACARARESELACVAVDTMELFTAVGKTSAYQAELTRVRRTLWPRDPIPIDLFMESERRFGVKRIPTLVLLNRQGTVTARFDGPMASPAEQIPEAISNFVADSP